MDIHDEYVSFGGERLSFPIFFKKYYRFRNAHVNTKFDPIPDDIQLPFNSCLHLLDNMYKEERGFVTSDIPNLNIPFIKNEINRKFIYHVKSPNTGESGLPIQLPNDYIFRTMGLDTNLRKFRSQYNTTIRTIDTLNTIPQSPNTLTIINHNPVFRVRVRGILQEYRRFLIILGTILNTASQIQDKQQYILMPLGPHVYSRDLFRPAEKVIKQTTLKVKNDFHYFMMLHWLNFVNIRSTQSMLLDYPKDKWNNTVFVFYYDKYYMFWTLQDIVNINDRNMIYNRHVNQFNALVLTGLGAQIDENIADNEDAIETAATDKKIKVIHNPDVVIEEKQDNVLNQENTQNTITDRTITADDLNDSDIPHPQQVVDNNEHEQEILDLTAQTLNRIAANIKSLVVFESPEKIIKGLLYTTTTGNKVPVSGELTDEQVTALIDQEDVVVNQDHEFSVEEGEYVSGDIPQTYPFSNKEEVASAGKDFIKQLDMETSNIIDKQTELKPKQRERLTRLAHAYKNITLGNYTLEQHISAGVDVTVTENTTKVLEDYVPDKSMIKSSIETFDVDYMHKLFNKHLAEIAVSFNTQGMFLVGIDNTYTADELNRLVHYKFTYEDIKGKRHSVKFTIPMVSEDGTCLVNGTRSYFRTQMANLPICKVSPVRVSLASNYNKTVIERNIIKAHSFHPYFQRVITKINADYPNSVILDYGTLKLTNIKLPYEYAELSTVYVEIKIITPLKDKITWNFNYTKRFDNLKNTDFFTGIENKLNAVYFGTQVSSTQTLYFFITQDNIIILVDRNGNIVRRTTFLDLLIPTFNINLSSPLTEWTDIKILDKKFPVGFLLCYRFGLQHMLKYLNISYKIIDRSKRLSTLGLRSTDVVLTFKDCYVIFPRYPLRNSLIITGLSLFELKDWELKDFEDKDVYYQLLLDKGYKINYLKGIDDTFTLFVDPITREVLIQMHEPTTFKDLLIRATDLLTNNYHKEASSISNLRYRSYERLNDILYNELSRQYAMFSKRRGVGSTFSINPNAVLLRIVQDQAMVQVDDINPIHSIKTKTGFTYAGIGGRTQESFVVNDRRFPKDGVGVISEATADSGNVAMTANTPMDPVIANLYGLFDPKPLEELQPTNVLSVSALLMPGATQDDGKRANFISIQLSHQMATKEGTSFRVRTGYEREIAHRCPELYAVSAKQDGTVLEVNDQSKMVRIQYKNGDIHSFTYGEEYGICSDLVTTQKQELTIKQGDTFKKNDILCYNPQFFEKDPFTKQVDWKHGTAATVALCEIAGDYEDSSTITQKFGKRIQIEPVQIRMITVDKNTFVHTFKKVHDEVDINDSLMIFEDADITDISGLAKDNDALEYIAKLNRITPRAKFAGKIVRMEVYTGCPVSELHPTLKKVYDESNRLKKLRHKFTANTSESFEYPDIKPIPKGTKFKGVKFDDSTVVIRYFIQEQLNAGVGDKIVIDSSLKSVISDVLSNPVTTESGLEVDVLFSGTSISNRIVCSPLITGTAERVLEELESQVLDIWNN